MSAGIGVRAFFVVALLAVSAAACDVPRDSDGTLDRVRRNGIRVGVVIDTPWTTDSAGQAGGIEGAFVRTLASELGAHVQWVHGQQDEILETLKRRELDLVVGGLTVGSPWKAMVGFTRPYYTDTILVAGKPGDAPPTTLDGLTVGVRSGDPSAAIIRKKGGHPAPLVDLQSAPGPVAAPTWKLAQLGRTGNPELRLLENQHVLAATPGENAWLVTVERVLSARRDSVRKMLRSMRP